MNVSLAAFCATRLFSTVFIEDDSSSDDDDEEQFLVNFQRLENRVNLLNNIPARIHNFIEITIMGSSDKEFQSHFRISRRMYECLKLKLAPSVQKRDNSVGRNRVDIDRQLLSVLWLLATPDSYRSIGSRFNMGKSTLFACFTRVVSSLNEIAPSIIKWPSQEERIEIKEKFRRSAMINGVVGAIDGTYVPIKAPKENPVVYINRKCFHGITLQAICDASLKFINCFTGYPSSVSDLRIFKNSDIYEEFCNNNNNYFAEDEFIIGDKAYPITKWCIPPYIDRGQLRNVHVNFNTCHAKTRQVIERAFALLFGRFRRLRYLDMNRTDLIPSVIIACCTLHNICLLHPDELLQQYINEGMGAVHNEENDNFEVERLDQRPLGITRRDELARLLL